MSEIGVFATISRWRPCPRWYQVRPLGAATLVSRLSLASLFIWAGSLKLSHPRAFAHVLDGYGIVPDGWPLVIAALAIPLLELLAGIGVLLDRETGYWLMLGMLGAFTGVLWIAISNDLDVDCGCFSLEERRGKAGLRVAFVRDWVMAAGAAGCLFARRRRGRKRRQSTDREERT